MHDHAVRIEVKGTVVAVLFTHAAFLRLERESGLTISDAIRQLSAASAGAIEGALLAGLEGYRERTKDRNTAWAVAEVRALLEGPLYELSYADLSVRLMEAVSAGARRGKAPEPTEPKDPPAPPPAS